MDVYKTVTEKIIGKIERGEIKSWNKAWNGISEFAFNRISKKPYSLLNQMLLENSGEYATFNQWISLGGKIKKGAKSEIVVFWKIFEPKDDEVLTEDKKVRKIPLLRYIPVFHISDVEGVTPLSEKIMNFFETDVMFERVLNDYFLREGISLEYIMGDSAYYSPKKDLIHLPYKKQFKSAEAFSEVIAHESIHSTGHEKRLSRFDESPASFGSVEYSKEELVAELGSAYLLNIFGIETTDSIKNNAAYIKGWLSVLENDTKMIVSAAGRAEKAVKYIMEPRKTSIN